MQRCNVRVINFTQRSERHHCDRTTTGPFATTKHRLQLVSTVIHLHYSPLARSEVRRHWPVRRTSGDLAARQSFAVTFDAEVGYVLAMLRSHTLGDGRR